MLAVPQDSQAAPQAIRSLMDMCNSYKGGGTPAKMLTPLLVQTCDETLPKRLERWSQGDGQPVLQQQRARGDTIKRNAMKASERKAKSEL